MGSCLTTAEFEMAVDVEENDVAAGQPGIGFANTQAYRKVVGSKRLLQNYEKPAYLASSHTCQSIN